MDGWMNDESVDRSLNIPYVDTYNGFENSNSKNSVDEEKKGNEIVIG